MPGLGDRRLRDSARAPRTAWLARRTNALANVHRPGADASLDTPLVQNGARPARRYPPASRRCSRIPRRDQAPVLSSWMAPATSPTRAPCCVELVRTRRARRSPRPRSGHWLMTRKAPDHLPLSADRLIKHFEMITPRSCRQRKWLDLAFQNSTLPAPALALVVARERSISSVLSTRPPCRRVRHGALRAARRCAARAGS